LCFTTDLHVRLGPSGMNSFDLFMVFPGPVADIFVRLQCTFLAPPAHVRLRNSLPHTTRPLTPVLHFNHLEWYVEVDFGIDGQSSSSS
jgi:hypothetical protein